MHKRVPPDEYWLKKHWLALAALFIATLALAVQGLQAYLQIISLRQQGYKFTFMLAHDLLLRIAGIGGTLVAVAVLIVAIVRYRKMARAAERSIVDLAALKETHANELKRLSAQHESEEFRSRQIRDEALAEARTARAELATVRQRIGELEAQLTDTQKQTPAQSDVLPVELQPTKGPSCKQFLIVTNKGERQKFHAQCIVFDHSSRTVITSFDLGWDHRQSRELSLAHEESHKLLIARAWDDRTNKLEYISLVGLGEEEKLWERWNVNTDPAVIYQLEIRIFGERGIRKQQFIVRPGTGTAIEMYEI